MTDHDLLTPASHHQRWVDWQPVSGLRNRHVQSMLASLKLRKPWLERRARALRLAARELVIDCRDGVRMHGLLSRHGDRRRPLVTMIHGWEGCADSLYLLSAAGHLYDAGFDIFRLHLRDHGPSHSLNRELFHAGRLDEVIDAIRGVQDSVQPSQAFLAGFSMGGNFALRVAARARDEGLDLAGVVGISPVLDPSNTLQALEQGPPLYQRYFVHKWQRSLRTKAGHFPDLFDVAAITRLKTVRELTDFFVVDHTPYRDTADYLSDYAVTGDRLASIAVPTWLVMADDDPVNPAADLARLAASPHLQVLRTHYGGHCGFIDDWRLNCWADRFLLRTFNSLLAPTEVASAA